MVCVHILFVCKFSIDDILNRLELLMPPGAGGDNIVIAELKKMATGIRSLNILSKLPFDGELLVFCSMQSYECRNLWQYFVFKG